MNAKKLFVLAIALTTGLLALAAGFYGYLPRQSPDDQGANDPKTTALTGAGGKFGPVREVVLPAPKTAEPEILDLEQGRSLPQAPIERFNFQVDAMMAWIRSHGLDLSCDVWSTGAACVTHGMTVAAVEGKCWGKTTEAELLGNPALAQKHQCPRRILILGPGRPNTYIFRTGEGTLGMLRLVGLSPDGRGVTIRYKLINPVKPLTAAL